jgi:hypothetical protein
MTAFTIQDVSRRSGLSEPTLRYYEEVGLIGPVDRDASSGHRRYSGEDGEPRGLPAITSQEESDAPSGQDSVTGGAGGPAVSHV